jgi:hypothetical protein
LGARALPSARAGTGGAYCFVDSVRKGLRVPSWLRVAVSNQCSSEAEVFGVVREREGMDCRRWRARSGGDRIGNRRIESARPGAWSRSRDRRSVARPVAGGPRTNCSSSRAKHGRASVQRAARDVAGNFRSRCEFAVEPFLRRMRARTAKARRKSGPPVHVSGAADERGVGSSFAEETRARARETRGARRRGPVRCARSGGTNPLPRRKRLQESTLDRGATLCRAPVRERKDRCGARAHRFR